ncbi:MAG: hypothetical protein OHK0029_20280 [Armatimonadaceae bacterium]
MIQRLLPVIAVFALCSSAVHAQQPRINALFPAGAKAGETTEVSVRGGGFAGAKAALVIGAPGVSAELIGGGEAPDEKAKPLFQSKCTSCHEARSPQNRTLNPQQWAATVDRMINARGADINKADRDTIVNYLQAQARAGQISLKVSVAKDAAPGMREIRVVTENGVSTAYVFEVGSFPEVAAAEPNSEPEVAQTIALPVVINGTLGSSAERDYFLFPAKKGQRIAFNLKGFRLNEFSQTFFNPVLYLYNTRGREIAKSLGKFGLDPALDWVAPEDGTYTVLVRDLLWKGSPASVYRLAIGSVVTEGVLAPMAARPGTKLSARLIATESGTAAGPFDVAVPEGADGVTMVTTPAGDAPLLVRDLPDRGGPNGPDAAPVPLPGVFRGTVEKAGEVHTFHVQAVQGKSDLDLYARRIGSALRPRITIKNKEGKVLQTRQASNGEDLRVQNAFPEPGTYLVEVADVNGGYGPAFSYCWEALDGAPDFTLTATPDCLNIPPGGSLPLTVRVTRRENLTGPITLTVQNLPPGVQVTPMVLAPDEDNAVLVLSAPAGATLENRVVQVVGTAPGANGQKAERRARPLEDVRINNQQRFQERSSQIVATTGSPSVVRLEPVGVSNLALKVNEETRMTVRVHRQAGFEGNVVVGAVGLPRGIRLDRFIQIGKDKNEVELTFRADGNARFLKERPLPDLPPLTIVLVALEPGRDGEPLGCTLPLPIAPK